MNELLMFQLDQCVQTGLLQNYMEILFNYNYNEKSPILVIESSIKLNIDWD